MNKWFFYRTKNLTNNKFYFGIHKTNKGLNEDFSFVDGYIGSGLFLNRAVKKEGIDNFKTEALFMFSKKSLAYKFEKDIVSDLIIKRKDCYNICLGGNGGELIEGGAMNGKTHSDETKNKMSESRYKFLNSKDAFTKEIRNKISKATKGKTKNIGSNNGRSKKVKYVPENKIFDTLKDAAEYLGINYNTAHSRVVRGLKNNDLIYI